MPQEQHQVALSSKLSMMFAAGEEQQSHINSVIQYYWGLRILAYAYAFAGVEEVPSHRNAATMAVNAPLDVNIDYADEALRTATRPGTDSNRALSWLEELDVKTRGAMVNLMRLGWPQGEALLEAKKELQLDWYNGPPKYQQAEREGTKRQRTQAQNPGVPPPPKPDTTTVKYCQDFNAKSGCHFKQRRCPHKKKHLCSFRRPDGSVCGSPQHGKANHRE